MSFILSHGQRTVNFLRASCNRIFSYYNYKAIVLNRYGEDAKLQEKGDLTPHKSEVVLQVECAGVNYADLLMMKGKYYLQPILPFTPGFEVAGNVTAVGKDVSKIKEGDRIVCLKRSETGAFAESCIINEKEDIIVKLPYSVSAEMAASIAVPYGNAYTGMKRLATEKRGNSFLIFTKHGTIGLAAMDLAQNVFEGLVFGASNSEEKLEYIRSANVISTFNWMDSNLPKSVRSKTFGKGVDYVVDSVCGDVFNQSLQCLKSGGHALSLGFSSGEFPNVNLLELHQRNATLSGVWMGGCEASEIQQNLEMVFKMFDDGFLKGLEIRKYKLADFATCVEHMQNPDFFGKSVLTICTT